MDLANGSGRGIQVEENTMRPKRDEREVITISSAKTVDSSHTENGGGRHNDTDGADTQLPPSCQQSDPAPEAEPSAQQQRV